jgi:hypothetical protein
MTTLMKKRSLAPGASERHILHGLIAECGSVSASRPFCVSRRPFA